MQNVWKPYYWRSDYHARTKLFKFFFWLYYFYIYYYEQIKTIAVYCSTQVHQYIIHHRLYTSELDATSSKGIPMLSQNSHIWIRDLDLWPHGPKCCVKFWFISAVQDPAHKLAISMHYNFTTLDDAPVTRNEGDSDTNWPNLNECIKLQIHAQFSSTIFKEHFSRVISQSQGLKCTKFREVG